MRRIALILLGVAVLGSTGHAQVVVHDTSVTIRNVITAALKEYLLEVQISQHSQLRRMAQRLSMFTHLGKYSAPDAPRWRRQVNFTLRDSVPNAFVRVNPLGLQVVYFRIDEAFQEARQ